MKIIIDLQACQGQSSTRGIGRYSMSLAKSILKIGNTRKHEFWILLSSSYPEKIKSIKDELTLLIGEDRFIIFSLNVETAGCNINNAENAKFARTNMHNMIQEINPDVVYVSSLFDGWYDNLVEVVTSSKNYCTVMTLYDLIPFMHQDTYLVDQNYKQFYLNKINVLKESNLLFAISESSKKDAIELLNYPNANIVNISAAIDIKFRVLTESNLLILKKYKIIKPFIFYAPGGFDSRKNFNRLIEAFAELPEEIKNSYQLVIASLITEDKDKEILSYGEKFGLTKKEIIFTDYVSDENLIELYNYCTIHVFPSLSEGFGLPILESMACGAPVIASNTSSMPEVVGFNEALFNPYSVKDISEKLYQCLSDEKFLKKLKEHSQEQCKKFSWDISATRVLDTIEKHKECNE